MEIMINKVGGKRDIKCRAKKVVIRGLLILSLVSERSTLWDLKLPLPENHVSHDVDKTTQITRAIKQQELKAPLCSIAQSDDNGDGGGKRFVVLVLSLYSFRK